MRLNNKTFLTIVISGILLMTSCVNDDDLPFLNDSTVSWESTLSDILEDNSQMLLSNKLELLDFSAIPYNFESEESFFNDDNTYIPVYYQGGTSFYISHIDSLSNDTTLQTNEKIAQIKSKVRNVLFSSKELDVVQLKWKKNNQLFSSIALFNSITGELEYDNVLINLPLVDVKVMTKGGGITPRVVSAEYEPCEESETKSVSYYNANVLSAYTSITWTAYGYWNFVDSEPENGFFVRTYNYVHERVGHSFNRWNLEGYSTHASFSNQMHDFIGNNTYKFEFVIVAFKAGAQFTPSGFNMGYNSDDDYNAYREIVEDCPSRAPEVLPEWYHSSNYHYF